MTGRGLLATIALTVMLCVSATAALADDWLVTKLRGSVFAFVDQQWRPLQRGDVVPDNHVVRTLASGRAALQRGEETVSVGPNSQLRIEDKTGRRYTVVQQYYGTVAVEAEVLNVEHFAVQTPYLAAIVKGTRFEVQSSEAGSSVKVQRGRVSVEAKASGASVLIAAGQGATVSAGGGLTVDGKGSLPQIVGSNGDAPGPQAGPGGGAGVEVGVGGGTQVSVEAGGGSGVGAEVSVGGTSVGVSVGGGNGVSVNIGGTSVSVGLGGLL